MIPGVNRQFFIFHQIFHHPAHEQIHTLLHPESESEIDLVHIIGCDGIDIIFHCEWLVGSFDVNKPVNIGAFGLRLQDRVHHLFLDLVRALGGGQKNKIGGILGYFRVIAQHDELVEIILHFYFIGISAAYFPCGNPQKHGAEEQRGSHDSDIASLHELEGICQKEAALPNQVKSEKYPYKSSLYTVDNQEVGQQNSRAEHGTHHGQSVGCFHFRTVFEVQHHSYTAQPEKSIHSRYVNLAFEVCGKLDRHFGQEPEADSFGSQRKRA